MINPRLTEGQHPVGINEKIENTPGPTNVCRWPEGPQLKVLLENKDDYEFEILGGLESPEEVQY